MVLRELILAFRQEIDDLPGDVADPCAWQNDDSGLLWKNQELVRFANAAEKEFCRRRPIQDSSTAALCEVAVVSGTAEYTMNPLVQYVERAKLAGETYPLEKHTTEWMDENSIDWETKAGTPLFYVDDQSEYSILLSPVPNADFTMNWTVGRLPLKAMDWNRKDTSKPEINERHHEDLLLWMGHLAFRKRDSETYNKDESDRYFNLFESVAGPQVDSHSEKRRRLSRNLPRHTKAYPF